MSADAIRELHKLLRSCFNVSEMRRALAADWPEAKDEITWDLSLAGVMFQIIELARRLGHVDQLLQIIRGRRPYRLEDVDAVERMIRPNKPTRRAVLNMIDGLSPDERNRLMVVHLPDLARSVISGLVGRKRIYALIEHYDTPHRGLDQLVQLIRSV